MDVMVRIGLAWACVLTPMAAAAQRRFGIRVRSSSDDAWVLWLVAAITLIVVVLGTRVLARKDQAEQICDDARTVGMRGRLIMRKVMIAMMMIGQGGE